MYEFIQKTLCDAVKKAVEALEQSANAGMIAPLIEAVLKQAVPVKYRRFINLRETKEDNTVDDNARRYAESFLNGHGDHVCDCLADPTNHTTVDALAVAAKITLGLPSGKTLDYEGSPTAGDFLRALISRAEG